MSFASFGPVSFPHDPDTKKTALTIHGPPGLQVRRSCAATPWTSFHWWNLLHRTIPILEGYGHELRFIRTRLVSSRPRHQENRSHHPRPTGPYLVLSLGFTNSLPMVSDQPWMICLGCMSSHRN